MTTIGDLKKFLAEWEQKWSARDDSGTSYEYYFGPFDEQAVMVPTYEEEHGMVFYAGIGHAEITPAWELGMVIDQARQHESDH